MSRILFGITQAHQKEIMEELVTGTKYQPVFKDILIVVHNQVEHLRKCIESIYKYTADFHLFVWDNGSDSETKNYLESLKHSPLPSHPSTITIITNATNEGFIIPNNRLAAMGNSDYLILLNSDTEVTAGWDKPLVAWLQQHPDVGAVGYQGCILDEYGKGGIIRFGYEVDYVSGWSLCLPRSIYQQIGLFDEEHLQFAYAEDCDFSLRVKEAGYKVYSLHISQVAHHENATIQAISKTRPQWLQDHFNHNHSYLRERWETFLGRKFTVT